MTVICVIALIAFIAYMIYFDRKIKATEEYREAIYKQKKPPKKLLSKRWWSWVLIVVLAIFAVVGTMDTSDDSDSSSNASPKSHKVAKKTNKSTSKSISNKTEKDKPAREKNTGKAVTLGAGKYKVGRDIKPGRYVIKAVQGSGNLSNSDASINVILGNSVDDDQVSSFTTNLIKGDKINIQGIESTSFTPTSNKYTYKTQLSAGFWLVGRDIKPGRYVIRALKGSGNLISSDGDDNINEILGTSSSDDQVTKVTADLIDGEVISTNLELIGLTKK